MEGAQFDRIAKSLASATSRRAFLKSALGLAVGASAAGRVIDETDAAVLRGVGQICRKNGECASGRCGKPDRSGRSQCECASPKDCPAGSLCQTATCTAGQCGIAPSSGNSCDDGNPCTVNTTCHTGVCTGTAVADGTSCGTNKACVAGVCRTGCIIGGQLFPPEAINPANGCESCQVAKSADSWSPRVDGASCDDGNACTQTDMCRAGVCIGGNPVVCSASDLCHSAGVCDPATGKCSNPVKPNGTSCNDQNLCSQTDTCQEGVCTGSNPVVCAPPDQCHQQGICNQLTGLCEYQPVANGTSCNDGNACTRTDTCQAGVCTGGNPVVCAASDQCHVAGICDPATGTCSNPAKPDNSPCDDGNFCSLGDTCQAGSCTAGPSKVCQASDQCHAAGVCDPATGTCSNPAKTNGAPCETGNLCTADTCQSGQCRQGAVDVFCPALEDEQCQLPGTCDPGSGICSNLNKPDGTSCDTGNLCTLDSCKAGKCTEGTQMVACPDTGIDVQCQRNVCQPATGLCEVEAINEGVACEDWDSCSRATVCKGGACLGDRIVCEVRNSCEAAAYCNNNGCIHVPKENGEECDGGTCCNGVCCPSGQTCCGGGSNAGCCAGPCCGGTVCCNFTNSVCCGDGTCRVGIGC